MLKRHKRSKSEGLLAPLDVDKLECNLWVLDYLIYRIIGPIFTGACLFKEVSYFLEVYFLIFLFKLIIGKVLHSIDNNYYQKIKYL